MEGVRGTPHGWTGGKRTFEEFAAVDLAGGDF